MYVLIIMVFLFFKQKTAYEMRISDWSSDVCSSDLSENSRGLRVSIFPIVFVKYFIPPCYILPAKQRKKRLSLHLSRRLNSCHFQNGRSYVNVLHHLLEPMLLKINSGSPYQ